MELSDDMGFLDDVETRVCLALLMPYCLLDVASKARGFGDGAEEELRVASWEAVVQAFRSEAMEPLAGLVQCVETVEVAEVQMIKDQKDQFLW